MKIEQLWRYPVKSMAGERIPRGEIGERGLAGDRAFALRQDGNTRSAKKFPALMAMRASYDAEPTLTHVQAPVITLEDGRTFRADDPAASAGISEVVGADVTIEGLAPASDVDFYRRRDKPTLQESRAALGLIDGEPLPDMSGIPRQLAEYSSPPGTFFDCFPLLVLTTASLRALRAAAPGSQIDERRFRPNILIEASDRRFVENDWQGRRLRVGETLLSLTLPCPRCVMTTIGFHDLPRDPGIMRSLVKAARQQFGIYAEVIAGGTIREGDAVSLL